MSDYEEIEEELKEGKNAKEILNRLFDYLDCGFSISGKNGGYDLKKRELHGLIISKEIK